MQKTLAYKNVIIYYQVIGSGKPVMLVHGFSEDSDIWKHQVNFLKDKFQLIIPDLPGSGLSVVNDWSSFTEKNQLTVELMAEILRIILDNEKIEQCAMIGHSMGGYITLAFAEKYPSRLSKLGLFHSTAYPDNEDKIQTRRRGIAFIKEYGAPAFLKQSIPNLFDKKFTNEKAAAIEELIERGKSFTSEALTQYYEAMIARPDRTAVLKNFNKPVLFIIGVNDKAVPPADGARQAHIPAISFVYFLRHTAHMGMWEEIDKSNAALLDFLSYN